MKLDNIKQLNEMPAEKLCPKCGLSMAANHYHKGKDASGNTIWQCKKKNLTGAVPPASTSSHTPVSSPKASPMPAAAASPMPKSPASGSSAIEQAAELSGLPPEAFSVGADGRINVMDENNDVYLESLHETKLPVHFGVVKGSFGVSGGILSTLEGAPELVEGEFTCNHNLIESFVGGPHTVGGEAIYSGNPVTSIEGIASNIGGGLFLEHCPKLTSLQGIHKVVKKMGGELLLTDTPIESHILGVLLIRGIEGIKCSAKIAKVEEIINKHLKGEKDMLTCQQELIDAGFGAFAKL